MEMLLVYVVVAFAWVVGGVIGGATGIGAIMVSMPIMTTVLSPSDAVLVSCLTGLVGTMHLSYAYRKFCSWKDIRELVIGCIPGCFLGVLVLRMASMQILQLMVCAMLVCFLAMQFFRKTASWHLPDSTMTGLIAGVICGFVSGSVAMVGAPLGIYILLKHWSPDRARGNMSIFYAFTGVTSVVSQAVAGLYTAPLFPIALAGVIGCAIGQVAGVKIGRRINQQLFYKIVLVFLSVAAIMLFVRAVGE